MEPAHRTVPPEPAFVRARPGTYLAVGGRGPRRLDGPQADALLRVTTALQMESMTRGRGFPLGDLESLWWPDGRWALLLRVPDFVRERDVRQARRLVPGDRALLDAVHREHLDEGVCAQASHLDGGATDRTFEALRRFARAGGRRPLVPAHEVHIEEPGVGVVCRLPVR